MRSLLALNNTRDVETSISLEYLAQKLHEIVKEEGVEDSLLKPMRLTTLRPIFMIRNLKR